MRITRDIPVASGIMADEERLKNEKLAVNTGGVYVLERVARDSADRHWPIMQLLTDYVREKMPWLPESDNTPPVNPYPLDIQAALTVVGRRSRRFERGQDLHLNFVATDLRGAYLVRAHLEDGYFNGSHLEGAYLAGAYLQRSSFIRAHLEGAWLMRAHLEGAVLNEAFLTGAYLRYANLSNASLKDTRLAGADLSLAIGLTSDQIREAVIDEQTILPEHLDRS